MDKQSLLILVISVISSHGYSIKQPGALTASFSGSSSSASAFSQSSSSSFSFNGNVNPNDHDGLKSAINAGSAVAGATASAKSAAGALSGTLVNAGLAPVAGSIPVVDSIEAGSDAIGSQKCSGGCGNTIDGSAHSGAIDSGSYKVIDSGKYTTGYTSGSAGSAAESAQTNAGSYKIVNGDKFNNGYSGADKTNYVVSQNYANAAASNIVGCSSCKGPFPGPSGSIHDYKPASSVPAVPNSYQPQPAHPSPLPVPQQPIHPIPHQSLQPASSIPAVPNNYQPQPAHPIPLHVPQQPIHPIPHQPIQPISQPIHPVVELEPPKNSYQQPIVPVPSGDIYTSKPVSSSVGSHLSGSGSSSGHVSAGLIASLPGAPGSIHDSKPASAAFSGASATAFAGASASSTINSGGLHTPSPVSSVPFKPSCQNIGSPGCATPNYAPVKPVGSGLSGIIPVLPGPSGSIYDSKPVEAVSISNTVSGSVSGSQSGSYSGSGNVVSTGNAYKPVQEEFVVNIPSSHPVVGPACAYSGSGSNSKCAPAISQEGSVSYNQPHASGESVHITNIPASHPDEGPACSYIPGSNSKCAPLISQEGSISGHPAPVSHSRPAIASGSYSGSESISNTFAGSSSQTVAQSGNSVGYKFPGPSGSIHDFKPASFVSLAFQTAIGANLPPVGSSSALSGYNQFPGPNGSINSYKPVSSSSSSFTLSFANTNTQPTVAPGSTFSIGMFPGLSGSIHHAQPPSLGTHTLLTNVDVPSIHPETPSGTLPVETNSEPSGTYFINKQHISPEAGTSLTSSSPSFSGQIPCADKSCGNIIPSTSGSSSGSYSAASGSQISSGSGIVYIDKDASGPYKVPSHDQAHESGGIVYQNEDGSYSHNNKHFHKSSENGQYAVSSNSADNTGVLIGPGTGHLPIESDKPFGTQGFGGGSQSFSKQTATSGSIESGSAAYEKEYQGTLIKAVEDEKNKPFGTQGFGGGSAAFSKSSAGASAGAQSSAAAGAHSSEIHQSTANRGVATGTVIIQKSEGAELAPIEAEHHLEHHSGFNNKNSANNFNSAIGVSNNVVETPCTSGLCGTRNTIVFGSQTGSNIFKKQGTPVKVPCISGRCQNTEVFIIEEQPERISYGSYGSGSNSGSGFATGQVLINQGVNTYDVAHTGSSNGFNYDNYGYHGNKGGYATGNNNNYYGYSGCSTGRCGGNSLEFSKTITVPSPGGFLNKLFGTGGLSGVQYKFGGGSSGSRSFAGSGSYSSASSGSFASAGASAHAASYAGTY